jgi:hypothetical protein
VFNRKIGQLYSPPVPVSPKHVLANRRIVPDNRQPASASPTTAPAFIRTIVQQCNPHAPVNPKHVLANRRIVPANRQPASASPITALAFIRTIVQQCNPHAPVNPKPGQVNPLSLRFAPLSLKPDPDNRNFSKDQSKTSLSLRLALRSRKVT